MIRVNLLPVRKSRRRSQGRTQLILFTGVIVLEIALLVAAYAWMSDQLSERQADFADLEDDVQMLEQQAEGLEEHKERSRELDRQLRAIQSLDEQRIGPVQMLDELQAMLSPIDDDSRVERHDDNWNIDWEPRRLWIESFTEHEDNRFHLEGRAANGDDVAEFLARMNTATYFNDVQLDYIQRDSGDDGLVSFEFDGDLDYTGFDDASADADEGT